MTSSLVGSEMCIRDRLQPSESTRLWNDSVDEGSEDNCHADICSSGDTVSYTHLTLPTICSV
eukprot:11033405-Prorocentrum_lima.AAC.1